MDPFTIAMGAKAASGLLKGIFGGKSAKEAQERQIAEENRRYGEFVNRSFAGMEGDVTDSYQSMFRSTPNVTAGQVQGAVDATVPAQGGATELVNQLHTGGLLTRREAAFKPVAAARINKARGQQQAMKQALANAISRIRGRDMLNGFTGGSAFQDSVIARTGIDANQQASNAMTDALLTNAAGRQGLVESDLSTRLANVDMPLRLAEQQGMLLRLPGRIAAQSFMDKAAPLDVFRLPQQSNPNIQATPNTGMAAGSALGGVADMWADNIAHKELIEVLGG
jgi:hypothetical protein